MVQAPEKDPGPGKPTIFLFLAALMVAGAIVAYIYEDWLFIHRPYRQFMPSDTNTYFIMIVLVTLFAAFFFLLCYVRPHLGNKILGRELDVPKEKRSSEGTVTYNIFADTTPASVKMMHRRRKTARHERHRLAREAREAAAKKKKKS